MMQFGSTLITAAIAFTMTNLDDLALLMLWFGRARDRQQVGRIVLGQYLGLGTLVGVSLLTWLSSQWLRSEWLAWLGLLPIAIGVQALFATLFNRDDADDAPAPMLKGRGWQQIVQVATVTIANGGDNVGVYIPFFAVQQRLALLLTLLVFAGLTGLWCALAYWLTTHPKITPLIQRYGDRLIPIGLIGLGIYIWVDNAGWRVFYPESLSG